MIITRSEDVKGNVIAELKEAYLRQVERHTPSSIKSHRIFDLDDPCEQRMVLTASHVLDWGLEPWLENYKKEAAVSTGGIRGPQNILYPWDSRYPLNHMGVILATLGKAIVLKQDITGRTIHKLCSGEVRYNTADYISLIKRVQAAQGIVTHLPRDGARTSIWMASFLIFMLDLDGGEYVTSSHGISSKIATKDLDSQGSQFIPEMSARFVHEIEKIIGQAKGEGYEIILGSERSQDILMDLDGIPLYTEYLKSGVATEANLSLITDAIPRGFKVMVECVGGCMYPLMDQLMGRLGVLAAFDWNNTEADPFFHGIGKVMENPVTKGREFFDYGCDVSVPEVVHTIGYERLLAKKEDGYLVLMLDPDGDRLVVGQVEPSRRRVAIEKLGIPFIELTEEKILTIFTPNQSFLLTMDFHARQLKKEGLWEHHPRFIITTTPSAASWVEWAEKSGVSVIYVPVGFKEIANVMKKIERRILETPEEEVILRDIFGTKVNLGVQPRLLFAGEESGGMITGPEDLIKSLGGRTAIAMREKSAGEACVITTAMTAHLFLENKFLSEYLEEIFDEYDIKWRYDIRKETRFYNESEPDPLKLKVEKAKGEIRRDKIDNFFLSISLALKDQAISIDDARDILTEALPTLDFSNLLNIYFVGDGTYFDFTDKYVEIRKSGTDAIIKGYSAGEHKKECERYASSIAGFEGEITPLFTQKIPAEIQETCQERARYILRDFQRDDA